MGQLGCRLLLAAALVLGGGSSVFAQGGRNYDVKTINFDLWCQEQAHLPVERCDKRLPEDEKTFNDYRSQIERYEIPYLQQKSNEANFDRVLQSDPVDRPLKNDPAAQRQDPNQPPANAPP